MCYTNIIRSFGCWLCFLCYNELVRNDIYCEKSGILLVCKTIVKNLQKK